MRHRSTLGDEQTLNCFAIAGVIVCDEPRDELLKPMWRCLEDPFHESGRTGPVTFESRLHVLSDIALVTGRLAANHYLAGDFRDLAYRATHLAWVADELGGSTKHSVALLDNKHVDGGDMFHPFGLRKGKEGECLFHVVEKTVTDQKGRMTSSFRVSMEENDIPR